jgi:hypothetical protein
VNRQPQQEVKPCISKQCFTTNNGSGRCNLHYGGVLWITISTHSAQHGHLLINMCNIMFLQGGSDQRFPQTNPNLQMAISSSSYVHLL